MEFRPSLGIVAAMRREIEPLVRNWRRQQRMYDGREFEFFEQGSAVAVCGGIGADAARRATEALIRLYEPASVISAGFAGALQSGMKAGELFVPGVVIDAKDGSRVAAGSGSGTLLSFDGIAGPDQKAKLARAYGAQAVDMEAAAVARGAATHDVRFLACKAISDTSDFFLPPVERFVASDGALLSGRFAVYVIFRPWLWNRVRILARNSKRAAETLTRELATMAEREIDSREGEPHPVAR